MTELLRPLVEDDREQAWALSLLAFGGDPATPVPDSPVGHQLGAFDARGRLLAKVHVRPYEQWWGGQPVAMGGLAGVAVAPHARGTGLAQRLLTAVLPELRERGQYVSALFPTAVGLYRSLDWEVVGSLDATVLPPAALRVAAPAGVTVVQAEDQGALDAVYGQWVRTANGPLSRSAEVRGLVGTHSVVALAVRPDGEPQGYAAYDRGRGYTGDAQLSVHEVLALTPGALAALLRSLASWDAVVASVRWRGPTDELALQLRTAVPPPVACQPWMLKVLDPVAAVAARGFPPGELSVGVQVAGTAYRLEVAEGRGRLEPGGPGPGSGVRAELPDLHPRGLALLYASAARTPALVRAGLLDRVVPELDAAFAGPRPVLLDYF